MEHVAATIYYWLGSTVDHVYKAMGTENQGNIAQTPQRSITFLLRMQYYGIFLILVSSRTINFEI